MKYCTAFFMYFVGTITDFLDFALHLIFRIEYSVF